MPALTLALLTTCASPPPARPPAPRSPPDLAAVLAPATPRPELVAPLGAILRGEAAALLLPLGQDAVAGEFTAETSGARVTCEGVSGEAPAPVALARKLHTGDTW